MDNYPYYNYPPSEPPSAPTPPPPPRKNFWNELGKFLGIFSFFFIVLTAIVMGPTIYANLSYLFFNPANNTYELPVTVEDNEDDIEIVADLFEQQEFVPQEDTIIIPKINVDAPIIYATSPDNEAILEAIQYGVAHYPGTAYPGHVGNVFLTGHSSYYWWSGGQYNQVFALLDRLAAGDLIYVYHQGGKYIYRVSESYIVRPEEVSVLDQTEDPTLTLMTCTPVGTNLRRLIVEADLIGRPPVDTTDFDSVSDIPTIPVILPLY